MRVLIIDDSAVIRKIVESALRQADLEIDEVLHASNGLEGLAALERSEATSRCFDLVLSDVHMPEMDGLAFLLERRRRNLAMDVPVVMITADSSDPHVAQAIAAGADGYIAKPFTVRQIQARVAMLLPVGAGSGTQGRAR